MFRNAVTAYRAERNDAVRNDAVKILNSLANNHKAPM